jgi:hypothetical protein
MGLKRNIYKVLVRRRRRWKNNIKIELEKIGKEGGNGLIWLRMAISGGLL